MRLIVGLPERPSGSQIATEHQVQLDLESTQSRKQRETLAPKALINYVQAAGSSSPGGVESTRGSTKDITEADNYPELPPSHCRQTSSAPITMEGDPAHAVLIIDMLLRQQNAD